MAGFRILPSIHQNEMIVSKPIFRGLGVALVTPFTLANEIDFHALDRLLAKTNAADYWVIQGTTGETSTLNKVEKEAILNYCISHNPIRKPIVLGLGGNNTAELCEAASELNPEFIDAILSVAPYYSRPSQEGLIAHYTAIADASTVSVILYNVPSRSAIDMYAETTAILSAHPNIIGIKEANGELERIKQLKELCTPDFQIISGDDALTISAIKEGAIGAISVLGNAFPKEFGQCINLALNHDSVGAHALWHKLAPLDKLMYVEGNPTGVKGLLSLMHICSLVLRLPLMSASETLMHELRIAYHHYLENE
jgi:4-hydroxy-tetrahydrodipicolinate synthase